MGGIYRPMNVAGVGRNHLTSSEASRNLTECDEGNMEIFRTHVDKIVVDTDKCDITPRRTSLQSPVG